LANTLEDGRIALQHSLQQLQAEKAWIEHLRLRGDAAVPDRRRNAVLSPRHHRIG
jgi:hypothetical protein